jgi:acyl-[acyl carrier protein]--UDP-N-acetylglucosamine O-acyltransferase
MEIDKANFSTEDMKDIKSAYKKLYLKSKNNKLNKEQQDIILDKVISELLIERINKIKCEDSKLTEEKSSEIYNKLKTTLHEWKREFE